ncbi:hypothetical protein PSHI8_08630 [Polynucleobacter sp. SHI8]|uniref:DUF1800 family protein n=1 Tax=unclassified Polynucleobacter TaxID=2640945 RepID=UPI0024927C8F|nr:MULTISPECIES: DUF1800 family protein [unclassified Polynucleobacter]BDW10781.1 hypothetical protein PSHI2_08630 [Polynucleobacter sp. SHI2]BDW13227.1 hypothetical protein PSHI8_08630 [Polynucleobacter sp. SHI8]
MTYTFDPENTLLKIKYKGGKFRKGEGEYPDVDEKRPLGLLKADLPTLFPYTGFGDSIPNPERSRPRQEVQVAVLMRAIATEKPWEEEWVSFWRDHFSIYGYDQNVGAFTPHWEEEVIRKYCFTNFRTILEAQASHPAMLYYLNNRTSKAGAANENFARELFELHTLGKGAYLNALYSDWKKVPGAQAGKPTGYIDQDVYEAARAFTGWTVEDGSGLGGKQNLPSSGKFIYIESRHDNYQKRILATEFSPYAGAMADGRKVLDLCASHLATAKHLSEKLVRRFISDTPPQELIQSTIKVWINQINHPEQLRLVLNHLMSEAKKIPVTKKQKAMRPTRLAAKFIRVTNIPFTLGEGQVLGNVEGAGVPPYGWPSPDGPPDGMSWILSSAYMRQRMTLIQGLAENWWGTGEWDAFAGTSSDRTYQELMTRWEKALFGGFRPELSQVILSGLKINPADIVKDNKRACKLVGMLACAPSFQTEVVFPNNEKG